MPEVHKDLNEEISYYSVCSEINDEIDILFAPGALTGSSAGARRGGFYRFIIGIIFSLIFIALDCRRNKRGVQCSVGGDNSAQYYANKNRGLLQSFPFLIKSVTKITQPDGSPSALDFPQQLHHSLPRNEMKTSCMCNSGEKRSLHARSFNENIDACNF